MSSPGSRNFKKNPSKRRIEKKDVVPKKKARESVKDHELNVVVHRVRCLDYKPTPILAMAATSLDKNKTHLLAMSRENGSIELKCPNQKWRTISTMHGRASRPVHSMAWICHSNQGVPTLVGGSMDGTLSILDWQRSVVCGVTSSGGGAVQSVASLCNNEECSLSSKSGCSHLIAAGCEDGAVRIFSVSQKTLQLKCTIPTAGAAVLSLAWRRTSNTDGGTTVMYAGVADGTIRRYDSIVNDMDEWKWTSTLRMTVECMGRSTPTRVWSLLALEKGETVASGDSLGHVQFWNGTTGTLISTCHQNNVHAHVLCLASTRDESRVFASGVDSRIVCMEKQHHSKNSNWILTHAQRPHTHDVKAMAVVNKDGEEKLCSGGIDTKLCIYSTKRKEFATRRPQILYPWPVVTPVSVASEGRLLALRREDSIEFHKLSAQVQLPSKEAPPKLVPDQDAGEIQSTLKIESTTNLTCCAIDQDATLLATSDAVDGLLLFQLDYSKKTLTTPQVALPREIRFPCVSLVFGHDQLICATIHGQIFSLNLAKQQGKIIAENHHIILDKERDKTDDLLPVHALHISPNGQWLAACQNGMNSHGRIQVFSLSGPSYQHWWTLPKLEVPFTSMGLLFSLDGMQELAVSCINYGFYVFNVQNKSLSIWSETVGFPMTPNLPTELVDRKDYPVRFGFNKATPNKMIMGSFGAFCAIDLGKPMPQHCRIFPETHVRGVKRSKPNSNKGLRESDGDENEADAVLKSSNCSICLRYNSMLYLDYLQENELLVVEQPWLSVVASFPDAMERKVYGS